MRLFGESDVALFDLLLHVCCCWLPLSLCEAPVMVSAAALSNGSDDRGEEDIKINKHKKVVKI